MSTTTPQSHSTSPATASDLPQLARIVSQAFGGPPQGASDWVENKVGLQNVRAIRLQDRSPAACAMRIPMGQFFGGQSIPMVGVAGVGVLPEHRGKGLGRAVMSGLLREMHDEGTPLSSLYPATTELYRKVGYEQAGCHFEHAYPATRLRAVRAASPLRPLISSELPAIHALHRTFAAASDGALDRNDYIWERVYSPRQGETAGYVAQENGNITGYIFLRQDPLSTGRTDIAITDALASTPAAGRAILTFLAGFDSMGEHIRIRAGAMHPLFSLVDEPRYLSIAFKDYWLLRIVRVREALAQRGYPAGLRGTLTFNITDPLLPQNSGLFRLTINNGVPTVDLLPTSSQPDPATLITADINGLAQLYSGQFAPAHLIALGRISSSSPHATAFAHAAFIGQGGFCDFF
jgi:predicted acetyltransferase